MKGIERVKKIIKEAGGRGILTPLESEEILRTYDIPVVKQGLAKTLNEAVLIAEKIGYPVVLKIASPDITHKSDIGCVKVDITSGENLKKAYKEVMRRAQKHKPKANIWGVLVQKMIETGREIIVGMKRDLTFGPVVLFGLGGIFVEILKDISFSIVPITRDDALRMVRQIKGYPILNGYRGEPRVNIESIIDIILRTSKLAQDFKDILEIDLNPIFALEKGSIVIDSRILPKR